MATLLKFIIPFLAFLMFALAFLGFAYQLPLSNSASQSIFDDPDIAVYNNAINSTADNVANDANLAEGALSNTTITFEGGTNFVDSNRGTWKILTQGPKIVYALTIGLVLSKLGGNIQVAIILGIGGAILLAILIVAVVKFFMQGEGG